MLVQLTALTVLWIVTATCVAQFVGWLAELVRTFPSGALVLQGLGVAAAATVAWAVAAGRADDVVDSLPTVTVFGAVRDGLVSPLYLGTAFSLVLGAGAAFVAAIPVVALVARRPTPGQSRLEAAPVRSVPGTGSALTLLTRLDRRLVARAAPLRRGLTVLTLLPVLVVALVPLPWSGLAVLPALIASAAGLLYGVNAFALDGPGAVWRDTLPEHPAQWLDARLIVLAQTCALSVGSVLVVAAVRTGERPTPTEAVAVGCAALVAVVQVVSRCARWSVRRPRAAQLRSSRDAPAPPVALAEYSVRLSIATTLAAVLFALAARTPVVGLPVALTVPFLLSGLLSLRASHRAFADPVTRSRVTATVSRT